MLSCIHILHFGIGFDEKIEVMEQTTASHRVVYPQAHGILTSVQAQPYLIDAYVKHELNLDMKIYISAPCTAFPAR